MVADTLPVQIELLIEMGYQAIYLPKDGKAAPQDPTYTGLDVRTPKTAATCIGGG